MWWFYVKEWRYWSKYRGKKVQVEGTILNHLFIITIVVITRCTESNKNRFHFVARDQVFSSCFWSRIQWNQGSRYGSLLETAEIWPRTRPVFIWFAYWSRRYSTYYLKCRLSSNRANILFLFPERDSHSMVNCSIFLYFAKKDNRFIRTYYLYPCFFL